MGAWAAAWGVTGVSLLLGWAIVRLTPVAWRAMAAPLAPLQWAALIGIVLAMAFFEGYRGFQRNFSPRVAARARHLSLHPTPLRAALAPLFCIGYFGAPRSRRVASTALSAGIVVLVVTVRRLDQPWRGIIDAGVVVGLAWGLAALWIFTARAFGPRGLDHPAEVVP
jgi:hypothetical protein